ncbi:MAG: DUF4114 domain-containing protein [Cyanobacteria bacterium P01_A01_bin.84]
MAKNIYSNDIDNNLDVSAATYLGGSGDDATNAVDISIAGDVVIVGGLSSNSAGFSGAKVDLLGGGQGSIVRYDSQTNEVISTTKLPGKVLDLQVSDNGDIAVAYEGGIAVLNADASQVKWSLSRSDVSRISISKSGKVAVMRDITGSKGTDRIELFDNTGKELQSWKTDKYTRHFYDVAVTDQNGGQVIGVGYEQKTNILQVGFAQSWSFEGEEQWKNYDYSAQDLDPKQENLMADTRIERVSIGRDGELYMAAYVNGGFNFSQFERDPYDLNQKADKENVIVDKYNNSYNTDSIALSYYGQYNLKDGDLIKGQPLLGRASGDKGNSVKVNSITATEDGTVILGGVAAYGIENRENQTIEGQQVNPYTALDGYIAVISPDLKERFAWNAIASKSSNTVVAARNGIVAAGSTINYQGEQITHNAIQEEKGGGADSHLVVIGGNDPLSNVELAPIVNPTPVEAPKNEGSNPAPVEESKTGGSNPVPVEEPKTGGSNPVPVEESKTGGSNPVPVEESKTGGSNPVPVEEPKTGGSNPVPVEEPKTGGSNPVPVDSPKTNIIQDNSSISFKDRYSNGIDNNLDISAATYLGGAEDDVSKAVDISLDGKTVLVGGTLRADLGVEKTTLLGGGTGSIVRYDNQTNEVISVTELPKRVSDIQVADNGDIVVAYGGGFAVLNADATEVKWSKSLEGASRISVSESGKIAVMQDIRKDSDRVVLFDAQGNEIQSWETGSTGRHFNDVVVTDKNGGQLIATGYDQKHSDLQVAFTQSWSYEGEQQWQNYNYNPNDIKADRLTADTRGERLTIGQDGKLYIAHYINGGTGASIFSREALDLSQSAKEENVVTDKYNNPYNTGPMSMIYYGEYDLNNGELVKGQSLLGRRDGDNGNTVKIDSISVTKDGTVILGGTSAYGIENRKERTIEGQQANTYTALDGYIAVISPDFKERFWSPVSSKSSNAVAAERNGVIAVAATTNYDGDQITHNAVQEKKGGQADGFLVVIGGEDPLSNVDLTPTDDSNVINPVTPVDNPVVAPVDNPVVAPVDNPVVAPVDNPVVAPVDNPVVAPVDNPVVAPVDNPVVAPVDNPVVAPLDNPVVAPVDNPVVAPVDNPVVAPLDNPVTPVSSFGHSEDIQTIPDVPKVAGLIDLRQIDLNNDGQFDKSVTLEFSEIKSDAAYKNHVGYYRVVNEQGAVRDPLSNEIINPDEEGYARTAMMQRIEGISLDKDTGFLSSEVDGGSMIAPYLIANGTAEEFLSKNSTNQAGNGPLAYFSFLGSNTDGKQHIKQTGNNQINFEDMYGGGDMDFNDLTLKVNIKTRTV